jgi:phosphotriesterase-related protein
MVDFIGADKTGPERWQPDEVVARMMPYLEQVVALGITTLIDCTPAYLGRDVTVLQRLSQASGLHILTNTGWYQAPYLPPRAFELEAEAIADEWIAEWEQGIDGTGIKPGFIKIAVNPGPLVPVQVKIVRAAALTSRATGLAIAAHTGHYQAAQESLDIAETAGLDLGKYIVVHAQNIVSSQEHRDLAARGAWLEYDGIGPGTVERHVELVAQALAEGYEGQVLLSHDAGWYAVGEPNGGEVRPFTMLHDALLPALHEEGIEADVVAKLCIENPARAFAIG